MNDRAKLNAREKYLQKTYGMSEADYEALLAEFDGNCWVCRKPPKTKRLHVEHDHQTGLVRGLVCWTDNKLLGVARDNPELLRNAAAYLESDRAQTILLARKDH